MADSPGDIGRKRAEELRDGAPMRTTLVDRDFAIDILEWCADELDGKHDAAELSDGGMGDE